jgi:putative transposase
MFTAYKFRMYPDDEQKFLLEKHIGTCRFVWNYFLAFRNKRYIETGKGMSYKDMSVLLPPLKGEKEWLNDVNSQSLQQELIHLDSAFHRFFKKIGKYPAFKKKKNGGSFSVPQHFTINDNHLTIPKFKNPLRIFMHRNIEGEMRSLTISKTPSGKYYASILAESGINIPEPVKIEAVTSVGIDMGITSFLTTSDGIQINNPKNLKKSEKKLAILQKRLSGKQKGSNNRNKARIKVSTAQEHIANQRMDFHNRLSDAMLKAYDTIITEDLNVSGMMKNYHLAKSISDAGWSSFMTMLKTKAASRGKNIIEIGRFDPSSRMCSKCGNIKHDLKLSDRTYHCNECGLSIDRDLNAAINIKRFGLIQTEVPTDSGEVTPMEISLVGCLIREGISHVSLK